jgi:hypothetical protein
VKTWLRVHIGGQIWKVVLVGAKSKLLIDYKDEHVSGRTWVNRCLIAIDKDLDPQAREDTLLHELLHAAFFVVGAYTKLQEAAVAEPNLHEDAAQDLENDIVHPLTPVLHRLLKDLHFVFPKVS